MTTIRTDTRWVIAALTGTAGVLHLCMVPQHAQASPIEGDLFLLVGWAQLALAVVLITSAYRRALLPSAALNLAVAAAWALSRTAGLPGQDREPVGAVDAVTTAFELAAVAGAVVLCWAPRPARVLDRLARGTAATIPIGVLMTASLVLTAPSTAEHGHDNDHEAGTSERCDFGLNPAAYWSEAARAGAAGTGHHQHDAAPADPAPQASFDGGRGSFDLDAVRSLSTTNGELNTSFLVDRLAGVDDSVYDAWLSEVRGFATHAGPQEWAPMTDQAACDRLAGEIDRVREVAAAFPTPADAAAAGYSMTISYMSGIGSHWLNNALLDDRFELERPELLLYDGPGPDAHIVGVSYLVRTTPDSEPTQGFTGDSDHYHAHSTLCWKDGVIVGDSLTPPEACEGLGGTTNREDDRWMLHVWVVPGCESPWGLFSAVNPVLDNAVGMASGRDGSEGCQASQARGRYDLTPGTGRAAG